MLDGAYARFINDPDLLLLNSEGRELLSEDFAFFGTSFRCLKASFEDGRNGLIGDFLASIISKETHNCHWEIAVNFKEMASIS